MGINMPRYRRILLIFIIVFGLCGISWYVFAEKAGQVVQASLAERCSQYVNGQIKLGKIDLSLLGQVRVKDLEIYSKQGDYAASCSKRKNKI